MIFNVSLLSTDYMCAWRMIFLLLFVIGRTLSKGILSLFFTHSRYSFCKGDYFEIKNDDDDDDVELLEVII